MATDYNFQLDSTGNAEAGKMKKQFRAAKAFLEAQLNKCDPASVTPLCSQYQQKKIIWPK